MTTPAGRAADMPLLDVKGPAIEVSTRRGPARVIDGVSLRLGHGEALGVAGESGCGKSITMLGLLGLLPPTARVIAGEAVFDGTDLLRMPPRELRRVRSGRIGMIFPDPMTLLDPVLRIGEQLIEPLLYHRQASRRAARDRAVELMQLVGIPGGGNRLDSCPHQLSGGQRQRVMIAQALACEP